MYKIIRAEELTTNIYLMEVEAPRVAKKCLPGQFVIVRMNEEGERIPLTICDYNREAGTITIVFQIVGGGTLKMSNLKAGDAFHDFVGPLGRPSELVEEDLETLKQKKMPVCKFGTKECRKILSHAQVAITDHFIMSDYDNLFLWHFVVSD